jgi:hypothetical protein
MMPLMTRPFELLKLVRDGIITHVSDLRNVEPRTQLFVDGAIENLVRSGLVARSPDGRLSPTARLHRTFAGLGVSLTQLAPFSSESVIAAPVFGPPAAPVLKADVFVLMPFVDELRALYDGHIKPLAHTLGITVARADDFFTPSSVVSDVWNSIYAARVVIGDCTGRNANVFYEIGIAHTLGKPVILLAQDGADVPFDIRHIRVLIYAPSAQGMADLEARLLAAIRYEMSRPTSLADVLRNNGLRSV